MTPSSVGQRRAPFQTFVLSQPHLTAAGPLMPTPFFNGVGMGLTVRDSSAV